MDKYEVVMELFLEAIKSNQSAKINEEYSIPVGVSNRHVHLSQKDLNLLFGEGHYMTRLKDLSQPGQYACKETVIICGPKGAIEKVRILGPVRSKTQVEILAGDAFKLGISPEVRMSGNICGTSGITLIGPKGSIQIDEGLIVAQRHIHMSTKDAEHFKVYDGQIVSIQLNGLRGGIYDNVAIRANDNSKLECHLDIEEANAMGIDNKSKIKIINND